jgi:NADPH:quinone reductase-like Zn-dependent oxidoreductase
MRAAVIIDGRIELQERPDPVPAKDEVLIRIRAAGLNGADLSQRAGRYPAPAGWPADIPGLECAGELEDGTRVMALLGGGGQAELVAVHERCVLPIPEHLGFEEAGGFMEVFCTAHDALFTQAQLQPGERLLVTGAAGGVGLAAVALGLATGARVTASTRHSQERLRALGADTDVEGEYDVILELVGGENLAENLVRLAPTGRVCVIGTGAGSRAEIDFGLLMRKRARIHGSVLRARSREEKEDVVRRLDGSLRRMALTVPVEESFPLERIEDAYARFAGGGKFGKLVVLL